MKNLITGISMMVAGLALIVASLIIKNIGVGIAGFALLMGGASVVYPDRQ